MRLRDEVSPEGGPFACRLNEVMLRTFDFAPFTVQLSALTEFSHARSAHRCGRQCRAPSHNIERSGETYRISVAVAGFTGNDLSIEAKENTLTIHGEKLTNDKEKVGEVLYQGIAARTFERSFQLADYVQVKGASLENGLLHVDLVREIPEAMKPRAIPIASSSKVLEINPTKVAA
jgi:molecular chaperone IbpA